MQILAMIVLPMAATCMPMHTGVQISDSPSYEPDLKNLIHCETMTGY